MHELAVTVTDSSCELLHVLLVAVVSANLAMLTVLVRWTKGR
jgi:hypothetical protein